MTEKAHDESWPPGRKVVFGMLHLSALPGSPAYGGSMEAVRDRLLRDAEALAEGGVHALMMENFGDAPFYPGRVPAHVLAHMTALAGEVRRRFDLPLGINVLRNDGRGALAAAHAVGASFVRVNVLCGARLTDQGVIEGIAHDLLRDRAMLRAETIKIFADVNVKHSTPLGVARPIEEEAADVVERGGADALVVSGSGTGRPADRAELETVRGAAEGLPVFIGSGVTPETVGELLDLADGFIVGSAIKIDGRAANPVDPERVRALMSRIPR